MAKRLIAFLSILSLSISLPLIPASAAAKAGDKCAKAGSTEVVQGKKYTCVKKGKNLVWDKGIIQKVSGTNKTTQIPVAPLILEAPTSFDNLVENYKGISYAAWSKSSAAIKSSTSKSPEFKAVTGANTKLAYLTPATAFDLVKRMYGDYPSSSDFTVLSFNYKDRLWAQEQMKLIQPSSTDQWITDSACATKETCWGGGVFTDTQGKGLLVLTTEVVDDNHTSGTLEAHEYTHAVQQNQMRGPQPWPTTGNWPPTWYLEGQAEFTQNAAIYYQSFELYTKNRKNVSEGLFRDTTINSKWIEEYFTVNQPSNWFEKYDRWRQYDLGGMLVEALASIKGPASTMEVWKQCGTGMKFTESFEKVYGISFDKALPIISKAIALQLGRN